MAVTPWTGPGGSEDMTLIWLRQYSVQEDCSDDEWICIVVDVGKRLS
jgi:hypothetical protein